MAVKIRKALEQDLNWILGELKKFAKFFGSHKSLYGTDEHVRSLVLNLIEKHLFLVAENEGELLGFISGLVTKHSFNPDITVLSETFWWVAEQHRGSRAGVMLRDAYVQWGKENLGPGDWITFTLEEKSPVNDRVLTSQGFRLQEKNFLLEVQ